MRTRTLTWLAVALLATALTAGCSGAPSGSGESATTEAAETAAGTTAATGVVTEEQARQAGAIAKAIEAEPTRMEEILQQHQMTEAGFQELLYDIAQDPKLTEAYEAAKAAK